MRYSLFYPSSKREITADYPELLKYQEFKGMPSKDLVFVWYYGCKASPFYPIDDERKRIEKCLEKAFPDEKERRKNWDRFFDGFETKIRNAVDRMESFEPNARVRMKQMTEKMFENMQRVLQINADDINEEFMDKDGYVDWAKKKSYIDSVSKANEALPHILKNLESSFGVVEDEDDENEEFYDGSLMDELVEQKGNDQ